MNRQVPKDCQAVHPSAPRDPRGGFGFDPEFTTSSVIDGGNGGTWSNHRGELTDPYFDPTQIAGNTPADIAAP